MTLARLGGWLGLVLVAVLAGTGTGPAPVTAGGATIVVDTLADPAGPGECGLRAAIVNANQNTDSGSAHCAAGTGNDTITFSVSGTIVLSSGLPQIGDEAGLTIDGRGAVTVSGAGTYLPFFVAAEASLTLESITVSDGASFSGGAIFVSGSLIADNSRIENSSALDGGGVYITPEGSAELNYTTVSGNEAGFRGGGIAAYGMLVLNNSTVKDNTVGNNGGGIWNGDGGEIVASETTIGGGPGEGNSAGHNGGAIFNANGGQVTLTRSTLSGNSVGVRGGGIYNAGDPKGMGILTVSRGTISENNADGDGGGLYSTGTANIDNSTISGNVSGGQGGGAFVGGGLAGGPTTLINVTVTNNAGDNAVFNNFGSATLANTIIADQASGADCGGWEFTSLGFNLDSDVTCDLGAAGDRPGADANLAPLADNGGPTMTHRLLEGSAAINAGNNGVCKMGPIAGVDQRGVPRPQGAVCDIGAFELGAERIWGDLDCDGNVAIGDALKTARYLLGLSVSQEDGCPEPGAEALVNATPRAWGDVDCDASVAIGDALKIARWLLGLGVSQEDGCPEIGSQVEVAG